MEEKLVVKIMADVGDLKKGMADVKGQMDGVKKHGEGLSKVFKTIAKVAIAAFSIKAIASLITNTAEATDRIDKMSQKIGISRQGFQEWDYILSQNGMNIDQLQTGMKGLVNAVDQAIDGTGKGAESFKKLGVSVVDVNGNVKNQETIFNETVIALQGMEDGTEKAKLANDLFGKSGSEMMPLLNGASGSVEELKKQAQELGIIMGDDAIDAGVKFTDSLDSVKRAGGALVSQIGVALLPIVQKFLDWVIENMPAIRKVFDKVFNAIGIAIDVVVEIFKKYLLPVIKDVVAYFKKSMPEIQDKVDTAFSSIKQVWNDTLKPAFIAIADFIGVLWDVFKAVFPVIETIVKIAFKAIKLLWDNVLKPVFDFIVEILKVVTAKFKENMPAIQDYFKKMAETLDKAYTGIIKPVFEFIGVILKWLLDKFKQYIEPIVSFIFQWFSKIYKDISKYMGDAVDFVSGAIEKITKFFGNVSKAKDNILGIFEDVKNGIKEKIEWARDKVKEAIDKIKGFFEFKWKLPELKMPSMSITGGFSLAPPSVPKFKMNWNARGAIFKKPTVLANGQGVGDSANGQGSAPEVVAPLSDLKQMLGLGTPQSSTTINLNGDYNFRDKEDMDYMLNQLALATKRK